MTAFQIPNLAMPAGTSASEWFDIDDRPWRWLHGATRTVTEGAGEFSSGEISVRAGAVQNADGAFDSKDWPGVELTALTNDRLTPDQARRLAAALLEAADEVDGWANR